MFLPISQYYAPNPTKTKRLRKKELQPHNAQINDADTDDENAIQQRNITENTTQSTIATTSEYDELTVTSSSASSATDHSFENSNTNRI